jgi:hypothetical protein
VEGSDFYREQIQRQRVCGKKVTLRIIEDHCTACLRLARAPAVA